MMEAKDFRKIPKKSIILPELIPFEIPGFLKHSRSVIPNVLAFQKIDSEKWYEEFLEKIVSKIGKEYFPVMRMSDGEYTFLLGYVYPYYNGHTLIEYLKKILIVFKAKVFSNNQFNAATLPNVSSGNYSFSEININKKKIAEQIKFLSEKGILALHLTYSLKPFQEQFHSGLNQWFERNDIQLNQNNYYPFYFVYAMLRGLQKSKFIKGLKILIFHSATGPKKEEIISALQSEGAHEIFWYQISPNRSMFEKIDLKEEYFEAEIAFIGAGVGKFNILVQLEPLKIPCIDAGFVFEVWADEINKWRRPMMVNDIEWDDQKISF